MSSQKVLADYSLTNYFSKIVLDYLSGKESLKPFCKHSPRLESFAQIIQDKVKGKINRKVLVEILKTQNDKQQTTNIKQNVELLLNENTFTVTTAYQPTLFTGYLYFIYKIISTINLSERLKEIFAPIIEDEILNTRCGQIVNKTIQQIEDNSYDIQAKPGATNLFYLTENSREKIEKPQIQNSKFKIPNFILLFLLSVFCNAQEKNVSFYDGKGIEAVFSIGKIVKHTKNFQPAVPPLSSGVEINFIKKTDEKKLWHQLHHYPEVGWAVIYTNFGNEQILGSALGIFPNISFPVFLKNNFSLHLRLGCGAVYVNKPYHIIDNPTNNVIGSHINNITTSALIVDWKLSSKIFLHTSASFTHFSNGNFQSPNLGINLAAFNVGMKYFPKPITNYIRHLTDSFPKVNKKFKINLKSGFALSDRSIPNAPKYPIYTGSVYVTKFTSLKNKVGCGIEVEYNKGIYDTEVLFELFEGEQQWVAMRLAGFVSDELMVGQVGIMGEIGIYAHNKFGKIAPFYSKIAVKHYFFNIYKRKLNWFYGIYLKSHYAQAEFFELATGISF